MEIEFVKPEQVIEVKKGGGGRSNWNNDELRNYLMKVLNYIRKHRKPVYIPFEKVKEYYTGDGFKNEKYEYVTIYRKIRDELTTLAKSENMNIKYKTETITFKIGDEVKTGKALYVELA